MVRGVASRREIRRIREVRAMAKVGFIGLGIMGEPMCRNVIRKGHDVAVYNRTRAKMDPLIAAGAKAAASLAELVRRSEVVITMVSDPAAVRDVVTARGGLLSALSPGMTYIDMTTVSPETSREIAILVRGTGASFLEAPVLGSRLPAAEGTLLILTGGDEEVSRRMEPLLLTMGNRVIHMGDTGMAAHMKLIINQIMGAVLCAFAEAALTGMEAGLPAGKILEVIDRSVVACPAIRAKGPDMLGERVFTPHFPLKHAHKDMRLAVEAGKAAGVPTPVTKAACDLFAAARDKGVGDRDASAVLRALTDR
jgi:glyoxylate/succinic semialdehyde reductase